jgi:hypothetical protein
LEAELAALRLRVHPVTTQIVRCRDGASFVILPAAAARTSPLSWNAHLVHGHTWRLRRRLFGAYRNHNQPDNANNNIVLLVDCLPQHPLPSEPLEGIPAGAQEGSRPAPEIGDPGKPGLPRPCRRTIRTAPFFSRQS